MLQETPLSTPFICISQCTDRGVKPVNEDSVGARIPSGAILQKKGVAAVIADGLSCAESAQEASQIAVLNFLNDYFSTPDSWQVTTAAQKVINALNRWLIGLGYTSGGEKKAHLSTLSAIILTGATAHIFHIGDCRVYLFRDGVLKQITRDHVVHVKNNQALLTRALGMDFHLDVDYHPLEIKLHDIFFLVSDGVYPFVKLEDFCQIPETKQKKNSNDWDILASKIVNTAIENGSQDNASCITIFIEALPEKTEQEHVQFLMKVPFPPALSVGTVIDGLKVLKIVSSTRRSELYLVEDLELKQKMILKAPSINFVDDVHYIEQFIMEEWVGRVVNHPSIIKVLEKKREAHYLYYLMEYIEGETLDIWMQKNHKDVQRCLALFQKLVKGVRALHRKEVIHQDLKPMNIMIGEDDHPIILDLGSARLYQSAPQMGQNETPLGTLDYSAPELYLHSALAPQSDQFSLGVMLYEMLSLKKPYGDHYVKSRDLTDFLRLQYRPVHQYNPMVPVWMDYALQKALSIDLEKRYTSLSEFVFDLTTPNPALMPKKDRPLLEREPVLFWKALSLFLFFSHLILLAFYVR